jgi:RsiW-degrading membrane proteinase PrsW (M82 family)
MAYQRRRAGVPLPPTQDGRLRRVLRSRWTWTLLAVGLLCCWCGRDAYLTVTAPLAQSDQTTIPGLNDDALRLAAKYAALTLVPLTLLFLLADRFRPQRLVIWLIALLWGGLVAVDLSLNLNDWVGARLAVVDQVGGTLQSRVAIYVAPFVEESTKATVIFLIAFLDRGRITSRLSGVVLAGLSAVGFAFTENIVYYARVIVYGSYTESAGDVQAALIQIVKMRGLYTCFGHPLFTMMTGLGVAVAVRQRSKLVRVLAPVAGFLLAALSHMLFNFVASLADQSVAVRMYIFAALPLVAGAVLLVVTSCLAQGRLIRDRLTDYVVMGWLPATYPALFGRLRTRGWALAMSLWHGSFWATWRLQRAVTELAHLRDGVTRGLVDQGGLGREHELIGRIRQARSQRAIENPGGLRPYLWRRRGEKIGYPGPLDSAAPLASPGLGAGSPRSTAVDPRWGPPA